MSQLDQITKDLSLRVQQAVPNPQSGRVQPLSEQNLQRRLERFYQDAGAVRFREKLGIISWARVMLGLRERLLRAGYPASMVSPLIRSTLFQSARPDIALAPAQSVPASSPASAASAQNGSAAKAAKPEHAGKSVDTALASARQLQEAGKRQRALAIVKTVVSRNARHFDALVLQGTLQAQMGDDEAAIDSFQLATQVRPESSDAHNDLGTVLMKVGESRRARDSFDEAIRLSPERSLFHQNRGLTFVPTFEMDQLLRCMDLAIKLEPEVPQYHVIRGFALQEMSRFDEAVASYREAERLAPEMPEPKWNLSLLSLMQGNFREGWKLYEYRRHVLVWELERVLKGRTEWKGEQDLNGKRILLCGEQGLGDLIQFIRYAPMVKSRGAHVIACVDRALVPVLQQVEGVDEILPYEDIAKPRTDFWAPLMSLPGIFGTTDANIPMAQGYLHADPAKVQEWTARLGPRRKPRVGLVWSGNAAHHKDLFRVIPLETLVRHLPSGFEYFGLQKDLRTADKEWLAGSGIRFMGPELNDFSDTAALCELMDVVVSVDTSVAHMSAALGRPTWVLLPVVPDWRWLLGREDNPWYSSVRLFRQDERRDWAELLERVSQALKALPK